MNLRIHSLMASSHVNGPGPRAVAWFQGCVGLNCPGCWNESTHSPVGGREMSPIDLVEWLASVGAQSLTVSGGEPGQQPAALLELLDLIHLSYPGMSVGMFSGYTEWELERIPEWPAIRAHLDFAVTGRFNAQQPATDMPLVTSRNQKLLLLSNRYTLADFSPLSIEVTLDDTGLCQITGFPVRGL